MSARVQGNNKKYNLISFYKVKWRPTIIISSLPKLFYQIQLAVIKNQ